MWFSVSWAQKHQDGNDCVGFFSQLHHNKNVSVMITEGSSFPIIQTEVKEQDSKHISLPSSNMVVWLMLCPGTWVTWANTCKKHLDYSFILVTIPSFFIFFSCFYSHCLSLSVILWNMKATKMPKCCINGIMCRLHVLRNPLNLSANEK